MARLISASAEWKPYARRTTRRRVVLTASMRALVSLSRSVAMIPSRWDLIVRASLTKLCRRQRLAQPIQRSRMPIAASGSGSWKTARSCSFSS